MATSDSHPEFGVYVPDVTLALARGAATPPPSGDPETALFADDFASGDLSKTQNGVSWYAGGVTVDSRRAYAGLNSVSLIFGPDALGEDTNRELGFDIANPVSEIWVEYYLYVPANFLHRSDPPSNNKFFQLNYNGATYQALTAEFTSQGDGTSSHRRFLSASEDLAGNANWPISEPSIADFIGSGANFIINPENWHQIRFHFKSSTDGTESDGLAEFFVDGALIRSLSWPFWNVDVSGQINGGYIMGSANSGYQDATEFRVDSAKFYISDPGWAA